MPDDRTVSNLLSQAGGQVTATAARPNEPRFESPNPPMNVQPGNAPTNFGPPNNVPMNIQPGNQPENIGPSNNVPMNSGNTGNSTGATTGQNFNQPPAPPTDIRSSTPGSSSPVPSGAPPMAPNGTSNNGNRSY
jgi:hypothetical protein